MRKNSKRERVRDRGSKKEKEQVSLVRKKEDMTKKKGIREI